MTALTIVQTAAAWLALPIPQMVYGATDPQTIQLGSLLNEELTELRKLGDVQWRKLIRQYNFTTVNADVQPNALPDDFDHFINQSIWDRTSSRPVIGPIDNQTFQAWKARPILTSIVFGFLLSGNDWLMAPNPPDGDEIFYNYISNLAVYGPGNPTPPDTPDKQYFTADNDTTFFDETMMSRGVRWRFLRAKGLPYEQEYAQWYELVQREASRSKGAPILNASGPFWGDLLGPYIPQSNWPGAV
jgi:hypothetical protein